MVLKGPFLGTLEENLFKSRRFVFRGEFGSTTEDLLPRERTVQALALAGTASAVGRLVVNVLTIVSTMNSGESFGGLTNTCETKRKTAPHHPP